MMHIFYSPGEDKLHKQLSEQPKAEPCHKDCVYFATMNTGEYLKKEKAYDTYYLDQARKKYGKRI